MSVGYQIKCEHCGAEVMHLTVGNSHTARTSAKGEYHIETDVAIRCPSCMHRLNSTKEGYERQVKTTMFWD